MFKTKKNLPHTIHKSPLLKTETSVLRLPGVMSRNYAHKNVARSLRGFTFIEIVLVMAIISIMAAMVVVSLANDRVGREVETNAREFMGVAREAQNYALTGKSIKNSSIPATAIPCYFRVSWDNNSNSYSIVYIYKINDSATCDIIGPSYDIATHPLKNGVQFSFSGSLYFELPHATFSGSMSAIFNKSSSNHIVCIYSSGRISDQSGTSCPS